ncbi:MAG: pilus assembly protein N-terminal domain-containing protein [Victivallaceae bacterium]
MKRIAGFMFVFLGTMLGVIAADSKQLRIPLGSLVVEDVPFKVESVSVSNPDLVKVEVIPNNERQIRVSAMQTGITDIQLLGGGMSQVFKVTISDDLREKYNALKRDLDAVPEVDISMNNGKLVLKGELSSIANQELKNKVAQSYSAYVLDLTTFRPTPEVMLGLQKNFEKAGFRVVRNSAEANPGELSITQVGEMLTVAGSVYGPEDLKKINSILAAQPWLTVNGNNSAAATNKVQAYVNVQILPVMLQIDVVHIAINKTEAQDIGMNWSEFVNNGFGAGTNLLYALQKVRGADTVKTASSAIGAGTNGTLEAWLSFLGSNGINRARRAGFLTFKSNDTPEFRKLHNGGTLYLSSIGVNNATVISELIEVQYGLILEVKGGLTGADDISIELKQELSYPSQSVIPQGAQFDLKKYATSSSISCKLGETIAIGGLREFTQTNTNTASLPYLRNIPVFKWFIAQNSDTFTDDEVITLICVHKMKKSSDIDPVAVELEKMKQAEDKVMNDRENEQQKNAGKWYEFWRW